MFSLHSSLASPRSWLLATVCGFVLSGAAVAAEIKYDPGNDVKFTYCYAHPPVLRIKPGDTVVTSTRDASNDVYGVNDKTLFPKLDLTKVNPQTGPFYIEGAEPGDTLVVHLDKIDFNREFGWGGSIPYFGALAPEYKTMMITPPVPDRLFVWKIDRSRRVGTIDLPNDKVVMSIGSTRPLMDALRLACSDLISWMVEDYGYDKYEALQVLGQVAQIKIANVVDPQYSVACIIDKKYLK